jgi:hypothetical protein
MDPDAYPDDMAVFLRMSDEDVERLFMGFPPESDEDLRDLAEFLADASETLTRPPRAEVQATHLSLLAGAIRTPSAGPQGPPPRGPAAAAQPAGRSREHGFMRHPAVRWASKVALAAATLVLLTAALALAGVDLPGTAAETAFDKVFGIELPNQGDGAVDPSALPGGASDTAVSVLTTIDEMRSGEGTGCAFGAAVSAAARGTEADASHCRSAGSDDEGAGPSSTGSGNGSHSEGGLGTAGEASAGAATEGAANADKGLGIAGSSSEGAGSAADGNAVDGLPAADDASGGKAEQASDARAGGDAAP